jgi:hypothetical protein
MALEEIDIEEGSKDFLPIFKYNAKAGRWSHSQDKEETEIENPTFVIDFKNAAMGWALFQEKQAPERIFDPAPGVKAIKTNDKQKRCLMALCYATESFTGVAEFCATSLHLLRAIKEIHAEYKQRGVDDEAKLPIVKCTGTAAQKDKFGTNYRPKLKITGYVDRPSELPDEHPAPHLIEATGNTPSVEHVAPPPLAASNGVAKPAF